MARREMPDQPSATMPRVRRGALARNGHDLGGIERHHGHRSANSRRGPRRRARRAAGRRRGRSSIRSPGSRGRPTRSHNSPTEIMRSARGLEGDAPEIGAGHCVEAAAAVGEPAERVVVMHHGLAVGGDLQVAFDGVVRRRPLPRTPRACSRSRRRRRHAGPDAPPVARSASRGPARMPPVRPPRTGLRPRPPHRAAARRRRRWCGHAGPCRRTPRPSGRRRRSSPWDRRRRPDRN